MNSFETPELKVAIFEIEDVITTSAVPTDPVTGEPIEPTTGDTGTDIL